jgi:ubiquinol-cytochrome c reductase core subunit 2
MLKATSPRLLLRAATQSPQRGYATHLDFKSDEASGFKIAVQEHGSNSPTSAITVAIKAGSRYEPAAGAAHALKNFVFRVSPRSQACVVE